MAKALYNELDPYCVAWLKNLISRGLIADGDVADCSITDLRTSDLVGYTQVHFFAGIAGWSLAARLAGWPDDRPLWTGSCPCQSFSVAGVGKGQADERHLWPIFAKLIAGCRPDVVMGEQVAAAVGKSWLDGVCSDLEAIGYTAGAAVVPACAVDAPHRRDRLWFVADRDRLWFVADRDHDAGGRDTRTVLGTQAPIVRSSQSNAFGLKPQLSGELRSLSHVADGNDGRSCSRSDDQTSRHGNSTTADDWSRPWSDAIHITGHDGKARRVKPGVRLLAHGIPARVGKLRAFGNAIVPQVAAEIIGAYMDCTPNP